MTLLEVKDLVTLFQDADGNMTTAVDRLSFQLEKGKILGLVGESGCGKSVTATSIMGLIRPPGFIAEGQILFNGQNLIRFSETEYEKIRGSQIAMVFQDPMTSLSPVFTVGYQMWQVLKAHKLGIKKTEGREVVLQALKRARVPGAETVLDLYPHQLSGGMRQRILIAMALMCEPQILIADEPTTALDVTLQSQILELILELQNDLGLSVIFITHDLAVVSEICDDVIVMNEGRMVEQGSVDQILFHPKMDYTQKLWKYYQESAATNSQ